MDFDDIGLSTYEKFVLVAIADHFNEHAHFAWPSQSTIAHKTGMRRPTVNRAVNRLRELGLLRTIPVFDLDSRSSLGLLYFLPHFDPQSVPFVSEGENVWREVDYRLDGNEYSYFDRFGNCVFEFLHPK